MDDGFSSCFSELKRSELLLDLMGLNPDFRDAFNKLYKICNNALIKSQGGIFKKGDGAKIVSITLDERNGRIYYEHDNERDCIILSVQENTFNLIANILITLIINSYD